MELYELAKGYLEAEGYQVRAGGRDLLIGSQTIVAEDIQFMYVWVPRSEGSRGLGAREGSFMPRFKEATDAHPTAQRIMLVDSLEGLTAAFLEFARKSYSVKFRVSAQFFDTAFRWEDSPEAQTALTELRRHGDERLKNRVRQPFTSDRTGEGPDLLESMHARLRSNAVGPTPINIVVGPAGIGKSYFFDALFAQLYGDFGRDKRSQVLSARPMPLLPQYLPLADAPTIKSLLSAYLGTEFARPLKTEVFEWRLTHGMATWLLDGLDEIISRDPSFFEYLFDLITRPDGLPPSILICIRDSLLSTNPSFREFCEELGDYITIYQLAKWDMESKRQFAEMRLGKPAQDFLDLLNSRTGLNDLAATPFYCDLLAEEFEAGNLDQDTSEVKLVDQAVTRIIQREYDKGLLNEQLVLPGEVREFAEAVAAENMEAGFRGVPVDESRELAQIILSGRLQDEELDSFISRMTQLALFSYAGLGQLQFAQEVLEHFLLGEWLAGIIDHPDTLIRALSVRQIPYDWISHRVVAEHVRSRGQFPLLISALHHAGSREPAFKNILQMAAHAAERPRALRDLGFERRNLSGLLFSRLDLSGVSFRGADLTDVEFRECLLTDACFADALLNGTGFILPTGDALRGADIGDLSRFYSIRVDGGRVFSTHSEARAWFAQRVGVPTKVIEPCSAALQLRHLFMKFVRPDGQPRRSWLDLKAVVAGKRFYDPDAVSRAALRYGYLVRDEGRERLKRPDGDAYGEMVNFVTSLGLSPGLRTVLDDVCDVASCDHVPLPAAAK